MSYLRDIGYNIISVPFYQYILHKLNGKNMNPNQSPPPHHIKVMNLGKNNFLNKKIR